METTDLYRHLGFTSHFLENPKAFYWLIPSDFPSEFWSDFWGEVGYMYPPLALLFFSFFGTLGIGLFWVKLVFTVADLTTALLIGRASSWWAGWLIFSAPASVWYSSHEGQYESLVTFFMVSSILSARRGKWLLCGIFFMLALQTKQLGILIAPYLLFEICNRIRPKQILAVKNFLIGFFLALLPFSPFYAWRQDLWLLPLQNQEYLLNPYYWPFFCTNVSIAHFDECSYSRVLWNIIVSFTPLAFLALFLARGKFLKKFPQALPTLGFWLLIKSASWVMNWYLLLLPACSFTLWRYRRLVIALFVIYWLQCGQQLSSVIGDMHIEEQATISHFKKCIWSADYQAKESDKFQEVK